jgi:hypothetical protein
MASNKTQNLNLDIWAQDDFFKRAEVNSNFTKIDDNVGNIANFKASGSSVIDKILNEFTDRGVNVRWFGAKGDGINDDTQAFKDAISFVRDKIIATNFKTSLQVNIPGGIYKITGKLTLSPFVHIATKGFVKIESYVTSGATIHFTAQSGDPTFLSTMGKQQYHRSPLINGMDGGMLIYSMVDRATNSTIGLEIGSQTDLGSTLPTSRYSVCDVAIEKFDVALQMNKYNNYIGTFNNLHLETNNTLMRFGTTVSTVTNSGENFNFHGGIFAQATVGFDWLVDGMDCNFYGCSFDFLNTAFKFQRGYKRVGIWGGHIEGCATIANSISADSVLPQMHLDSPVVFCNNTELFKGAINLFCDDVRWETTAPLASNPLLYLCDANVNPKENRHIIQGYERALSQKLNIINNSKFLSSDISSGNAVEPFNEYTITKSGYSAPVVTSSIPIGSNFTRALKLTSSASSGTWLQILTKDYTVKAGSTVQMGAVVYDAGASFRNIGFKLSFYDALGNLISTTTEYSNKTGLSSGAWNGIFGVTTAVPAGTHTMRGYYTVSQHITGESFYIGELYMGIS